MIRYYRWTETVGRGVLARTEHWEGWYLFGCIPIYTRTHTVEGT